ncbi:hypothetical protein [Corallococcus terminator]|uniref:Uncharacterized protein n=1 Tax=Corallococcus terminator TaxID=2316733 RepID=A0A3A8HFJ1_9BACT|nr:hypothetical protein [Corallococcus terminator]RKG69959.1 hypothetical protein D7V88_40000 [Corallococcus terminator]
MSSRISQGSPFQPATLKGPDAPAASPVSLRPPPKPEPKPAAQPTVDAFVQDVARDFTKLLGQVQALVTSVGTPTVQGKGKEKGSDIIIEGSREARDPTAM